MIREKVGRGEGGSEGGGGSAEDGSEGEVVAIIEDAPL